MLKTVPVLFCFTAVLVFVVKRPGLFAGSSGRKPVTVATEAPGARQKTKLSSQSATYLEALWFTKRKQGGTPDRMSSP